MRYYYCHRHGPQPKRPCMACHRAKHRKPRMTSGYRYRKMRTATLAVYDHRCAAMVRGERCTVRAPLEVHHVDGDPGNDLPTNRVPLCLPHHNEMAGLPYEAFASPSTPFVR